MFDRDLSGMNMLGYMFQNTKIKEFTLNRTYKKSGYMYLSRMFLGCSHLKSVTMSVDTSEAGKAENSGPESTYESAQTKEMFKGCTALTNLNLTGDLSNLYNALSMLNDCDSLSENEFIRAFSTWKWGTNSEYWQVDNNPERNGINVFFGYDNKPDPSNIFVDADGNRFKSDGYMIVPAP